MVEKDNYLLECGRYVERNPLRAGMAKDLKEYLWSSYRVYAYGKADGVTDGHEIYDAMGKENGTRQRAYREYVCSNRDREEPEIGEKMARGVIGAEIFQEKIEKRVMEIRRPREAGQENSLYLFVNDNQYENRPQDWREKTECTV